MDPDDPRRLQVQEGRGLDPPLKHDPAGLWLDGRRDEAERVARQATARLLWSLDEAILDRAIARIQATLAGQADAGAILIEQFDYVDVVIGNTHHFVDRRPKAVAA